MALIQLIYTSSACRQLSAADIDKILESSQRHNVENNVTGILLYGSGNFLQVLEGEEAAIDETMTRIAADDRHHGIIEILREVVTSRDFGAWAMGFRGLTANDVRTLDGYAPYFKNKANAATLGARPGVALDILRHFAEFNY
jgi:hypothetical protein